MSQDTTLPRNLTGCLVATHTRTHARTHAHTHTHILMLTYLVLYKNMPIPFRIRFVCSQFAITHHVTAYKTIHIYYLKKSHDSLNRSCD